MGYEFYQCFDYSLSLGSKADCPDRYPSRFNEIIESCRIIRLILNLRSYEVMYYSCYSLARCLCSKWDMHNPSAAFPIRSAYPQFSSYTYTIPFSNLIITARIINFLSMIS